MPKAVIKLPDDLSEDMAKLKKATRKSIPQKDNKGNPRPFDVYTLPRPDDDILASDDLLRQHNIDLKQLLPTWLTVYWKVERHVKIEDKITLVVNVDEVTYGDEFLQGTMIKRFSALPSGSLYEQDIGRWRLLGKNEARELAESAITKDLVAWGIYSDANVVKMQKYILRASYDNSLGDINPFEKINPNLVAFKNGTYNFKTDQMQPNRAEDYILNYHPYEVESNRAYAPETNKMLKAMMGDDATFFKEYIGYCFYRSYEPFNVMMFLHGSGGQGKSRLLSRITNNVIGLDNTASVPPGELASNRFKPVQLYGKELNVVADIPKSHLADTAVLKKLTGGDLIDAEYKGIQGFQFYNYSKLLFSANELPTFSELTDGWQDRLLVIGLINPDTRKVLSWWKQFDNDKIDQENSSFAMECIQLFREAKERGSFTLTDAIRKRTAEWVESNDHFKEFLDEAMIIDKNSEVGEKSVTVVQAYKQFCQKNNYSDKTSAQTVTSKLKTYGIEKKRSIQSPNTNDKTNVNRYIGLTMNPNVVDYLNYFDDWS